MLDTDLVVDSNMLAVVDTQVVVDKDNVLLELDILQVDYYILDHTKVLVGSRKLAPLDIGHKHKESSMHDKPGVDFHREDAF
jgi:hypothetical protein